MSSLAPHTVQTLTSATSLNRDFISKVAPRLAFANPAVTFDIKHQPTPVTKAKDPELQKRAQESAKQIQETGIAPSLTVDFRMLPLRDRGHPALIRIIFR